MLKKVYKTGILGKFFNLLFYIKSKCKEKLVKVTFSFQKNNSSQPQNQNIEFGAGLTRKMMQEIQQTDVIEISGRLAKKGIPTDFKGNKVVAWCCDKSINILEQINERFGQRLALPRGIYLEDFEKLNIEEENAIGFCNLAPTKLVKNSDEIIPSRVLYFDTLTQKRANSPSDIQWLHDWNNIDQISDYRYATGQAGTDSFLDIFIHEPSHNLHLDQLLQRCSGETVLQKILLAKDKQQTAEYQKKYGARISQICDYALINPLEAVACDMAKVIVDSLDAKTLMPTKNPFIGTPYEKLSFWQRVNLPEYSDEQRPLSEILRRFWNGKFD